MEIEAQSNRTGFYHGPTLLALSDSKCRVSISNCVAQISFELTVFNQVKNPVPVSFYYPSGNWHLLELNCQFESSTAKSQDEQRLQSKKYRPAGQQKIWIGTLQPHQSIRAQVTFVQELTHFNSSAWLLQIDQILFPKAQCPVSLELICSHKVLGWHCEGAKLLQQQHKKVCLQTIIKKKGLRFLFNCGDQPLLTIQADQDGTSAMIALIPEYHPQPFQQTVSQYDKGITRSYQNEQPQQFIFYIDNIRKAKLDIVKQAVLFCLKSLPPAAFVSLQFSEKPSISQKASQQVIHDLVVRLLAYQGKKRLPFIQLFNIDRPSDCQRHIFIYTYSLNSEQEAKLAQLTVLQKATTVHVAVITSQQGPCPAESKLDVVIIRKDEEIKRKAFLQFSRNLMQTARKISVQLPGKQLFLQAKDSAIDQPIISVERLKSSAQSLAGQQLIISYWLSKQVKRSITLTKQLLVESRGLSALVGTGQQVKGQQKVKSSGQQLSLQIKLLSGKSLTIEGLSKSMTVLQLKHVIEEMQGIPPDGQKLIVSGRQIEDQLTLKDCRIQSGCTVYLISTMAIRKSYRVLTLFGEVQVYCQAQTVLGLKQQLAKLLQLSDVEQIELKVGNYKPLEEADLTINGLVVQMFKPLVINSMSLTILQRLQGCWDYSEQLIKGLTIKGIPCLQVPKELRDKGRFTTALAIQYLQQLNQPELKLVIKKAKQWLNRQN